MRELKFRAWHKNSNKMGYDVTPFQQDSRTEVMQFTGLRDMKGVEIWEGDIVIIPGGSKQSFQVVYQAPSFVMKVKATDSTWHEFVMGPSENQFQEVIGNVWENVESIEDQIKDKTFWTRNDVKFTGKLE